MTNLDRRLAALEATKMTDDVMTLVVRGVAPEGREPLTALHMVAADGACKEWQRAEGEGEDEFQARASADARRTGRGVVLLVEGPAPAAPD